MCDKARPLILQVQDTKSIALQLWRKALLLKYIRLLIPFFSFSFYLSLTLVGLFSGEMIFVSFEVEKMRMFLVQSVVRWYCVLVWSRGAVVSFPM